MVSSVYGALDVNSKLKEYPGLLFRTGYSFRAFTLLLLIIFFPISTYTGCTKGSHSVLVLAIHALADLRGTAL